MSDFLSTVTAFFEYFWQTVQLINPGMSITLGLFFVTILLSVPLGLIVSLGAMNKHKFVSSPIKFYIWVMRGTPLMLQLLFMYYGLALMFGISLDNFTAGILAFALNYAAYFAEIFRAGIQSIDKGQYEAAKALGFSNVQTMWRIIIPQTISRILPPVGNEAITLVKDTSLVSVITLTDILLRAKQITMTEGNVSAYGVVAVYYLFMTFILTKLFDYLEKRFSSGLY